MASPYQVTPSSSRITMQWFDGLETVLKKEAELAGLLGHGSTIGTAREFIVGRVLRSILPPMVHIGSGIVLGKDGKQSKQIDIILYDPRFPLMEITAGTGLYFVEGVIATIEVKSTLTNDSLKIGLANCASVLDMDTNLDSYKPLDNLVEILRSKAHLNNIDLREAVKTKLNPSTYIVSFSTDMSAASIGKAIAEWYEEHSPQTSSYNPGLPSLIVAKGAIGLLNDGWIQIDPGDAGEVMKREHSVHARVVFGSWRSQRQFGWLALRLMHDTSDRLGRIHHTTQVCYSIADYLPAQHYFEEDMHDQEGYFTFWLPDDEPTQSKEE